MYDEASDTSSTENANKIEIEMIDKSRECIVIFPERGGGRKEEIGWMSPSTSIKILHYLTKK